MARHERAFWERVVAAVESGGGHAAVATRFGVSVGALRSWVYKLRRERSGAPAVSLLPVTIRPSTSSLQVDCGPHRLHFAAGAEPRYIAAVLRAIASD